MGCEKISPGCDNCYAAAIVGRFKGLKNGGQPDTPARRAEIRGRVWHPFNELVLHLDQLKAIGKMRPHIESGRKRPFLCFVNSMSDFWHTDVPEAALRQTLDAFEAAPCLFAGSNAGCAQRARPPVDSLVRARKGRSSVPGLVRLVSTSRSRSGSTRRSRPPATLRRFYRRASPVVKSSTSRLPVFQANEIETITRRLSGCLPTYASSPSMEAASLSRIIAHPGENEPYVDRVLVFDVYHVRHRP